MRPRLGRAELHREGHTAAGGHRAGRRYGDREGGGIGAADNHLRHAAEDQVGIAAVVDGERVADGRAAGLGVTEVGVVARFRGDVAVEDLHAVALDAHLGRGGSRARAADVKVVGGLVGVVVLDADRNLVESLLRGVELDGERGVAGGRNRTARRRGDREEGGIRPEDLHLGHVVENQGRIAAVVNGERATDGRAAHFCRAEVGVIRQVRGDVAVDDLQCVALDAHLGLGAKRLTPEGEHAQGEPRKQCHASGPESAQCVRRLHDHNTSSGACPRDVRSGISCWPRKEIDNHFPAAPGGGWDHLSNQDHFALRPCCRFPLNLQQRGHYWDERMPMVGYRVRSSVRGLSQRTMQCAQSTQYTLFFAYARVTRFNRPVQ